MSWPLSDYTGPYTIPLVVERMRPDGQAVYLLSTAAEWWLGNTVVNNAQTCATYPVLSRDCGTVCETCISEVSFFNGIAFCKEETEGEHLKVEMSSRAHSP